MNKGLISSSCLIYATTPPPIVEELAFRHFLLSILPFRANRTVATIAAIATAVYFSHVHDYQHWTTDAEIFLVGVILAIARIRTNGMLLPIALHAYTIALALLMDQAIRLLGR
ncbi:CPBP family intramembrane glutamic endopeptidase [Burkholderia pyrrocinia]